MWSGFPHLRPMAMIIGDTPGWYGIDPFGGSVHDVIGTCCDPCTGNLLVDSQYHHCCHSNLTRAVADHLGVSDADAEAHVHDVLNVFMCTGFTRDTGQYFMKASLVRPGDYLEFFAEIDLLGALSACPGGRLLGRAFQRYRCLFPVAGRVCRSLRPRELPLPPPLLCTNNVLRVQKAGRQTQRARLFCQAFHICCGAGKILARLRRSWATAASRNSSLRHMAHVAGTAPAQECVSGGRTASQPSFEAASWQRIAWSWQYRG